MMRCCLCGRALQSALVMIGLQPVGPVCARRAGLVEAARKGRGMLRVADRSAGSTRAAQRDARTLDLFEGAAHG